MPTFKNITIKKKSAWRSFFLLRNFFSGTLKISALLTLQLITTMLMACNNQKNAYSEGEMVVSSRESAEALLQRLQNNLAAQGASPTPQGANFTSNVQVGSSAAEALFAKIQVSAEINSLQYNKPSSWQAGESAGVRFASFTTQFGSDVSLVSFPGDVGGLLANVKRWLTQVQASPSSKQLLDYLAGLKQNNTSSGLPYIYLNLKPLLSTAAANDITGNSNIAVGIYRFAQQTLFVKLLSENGITSAEEKDFIAFLKTLKVN